MLNIGFYELIDPNVNASSADQCSETRSDSARTSLSDTRTDNESLNATSITGLEPSNKGLKSSDTREVERANQPLSDVDCNSDPLNVSNDISSCIEHIKVENLVGSVGCDSDSQDVGNDISSCIKHIKVESSFSGV